MLSQSMESIPAVRRRRQQQVSGCEKVPVAVLSYSCYLLIAALLGVYLEQAGYIQVRQRRLSGGHWGCLGVEGWVWGSSSLACYLPTICLPTHHLPTHLSTYLPANLPTYLPTLCLLSYPPAYLPAHSPTCPSTFLPTYPPTYLPTCLPTYLPACLPACPSTYLISYLPVFLNDCRSQDGR